MRYLLLIATVLGACTQGEPARKATESEMAGTQQVADDVVLATYALAETAPDGPRPTFHAARMAGDLAVRDGCIGLASAGKFAVLAFAPDDAVWDQRRQILVVNGVDYPLGTSIEVGGSASGGPAVKGLSADVPERCRPTAMWYVAPGSLATLD